MHEEEKFGVVMWKEKRPVQSIFVHTRLLAFLCKKIYVPCGNGVYGFVVLTSSIHLEYTTLMHGGNLADH